MKYIADNTLINLIDAIDYVANLIKLRLYNK